MNPSSPVRIGTRGSPLALAQTEIVRRLLAAAHGELALEVVAIRTSGEQILDRPLADAGGKGLFTKEIDEALLSGRIELAVHSAKDVPTFLAPGIRLAAFPPREDAREALLSAKADSLERLAAGAVVGTSSVRRQALVKRLRPDLAVKLMRGNVGTRLQKVKAGEFDAAVLALAGLRRLGLEGEARALLDPATFPPSVGQGAIAVAIREGDERMETFVAAIDHAPTSIALAAERAFLTALGGSCRAPIAGHARIKGERLDLHGLVIAPDGTGAVETKREGPLSEAVALGHDAGMELRARAPAGVLEA
ncbi:MAG TPA: hydroxymethylbilane synthase [Xanthobacteraceae bacterium]|nr:hydroxymethylbilane synthase [Xanthobacteraceae bacterium]